MISAEVLASARVLRKTFKSTAPNKVEVDKFFDEPVWREICNVTLSEGVAIDSSNISKQISQHREAATLLKAISLITGVANLLSEPVNDGGPMESHVPRILLAIQNQPFANRVLIIDAVDSEALAPMLFSKIVVPFFGYQQAIYDDARQKFYHRRSILDRMAPGYVVTSTDLRRLRLMIEKSVKQEQEDEDENASKKLMNVYTTRIEELEGSFRAPVTGYIRQTAVPEGHFNDGWVGPSASWRMRSYREVKRISLFGWLPDHFSQGSHIILKVSGQEKQKCVEPGLFCVSVNLRIPADADFICSVKTSSVLNPKRSKVGNDSRDLSFILDRIEADH